MTLRERSGKLEKREIKGGKRMQKIDGIGELLLEQRGKRGVTQKELAQGLCKQKELSRIEMGEALPGCFLLDALMSRLGRGSDKLEYVVTKQEYDFWVQRAAIERALENEKYEKAKRKIETYEKGLMKEDVLHFQYVDLMKAFLSERSQGRGREYLFWLESAMDRTMPFWRKESIFFHPVSWLEAGIYLLWAKERKEGEERIEIFEAMLSYIDRQWTDEEEKIKIYPFTVFLYCQQLLRKKEYKNVEELCERAVALLTKNNTLSNLLNLLNLRIEALTGLQTQGSKVEKLEQLRRQTEALKTVEREYGYLESRPVIFTKVKRELYLEKEIIAKNRRALGLTQERLSEDICSRETLSRIEKGRRAHNRNFQRLAERVAWTKGKRSNEISCWDYRVLEEKYEIDRLTSLYQYEEVKKRLKRFPWQNTKEGWQYVLYMTTVAEQRLEEKSPEEVLLLLKEALAMTLPLKDLENMKDYVLTKQEVFILNGIGIAYAECGQKEKAIRIYKNILACYKKSKVISLFQAYGILLVLGGLISYLEESDCFDEALIHVKKRMELELQCRKCGEIARTLTSEAYILERMGVDKKKIRERYIRAYYIADLMQETVVKNILESHFRGIYECEIES
ncbi:MAG: helix-turn-helix domain-containing protein [Acetivibrio ethanolgignens]